ncbi:hypothetical protein TSAR_010892 [Trichomalopsis sarcophagae]|uniref:Uncharacterized protein n=1 Tax=Trichomalopsis sarcophagae TaxID=543379 RepID=A0A232F3A9_9HYME|nr:hypothetical protein TSAR_010892 [Trichomalopsis sarcophagae]
MDPQRNRLNSIIITGSEMNQRTFGEEELWNSLQSTVLAGNLTTNDTSDVENVDQIKDLTTVDEESLSEDNGDRTQYEDILNMNICAIGSDDEAFFDCPSYSPGYSPRKLKSPTLGASFKYSPKYSPIKSKLSASSANYGNFLTTDSASGINQTSTYSGLDERTGSLLAQIVDDFNNIRSEAQSTPNLDQDVSEHFSLFQSPLEQDRSTTKVKNSENRKDSKRKLSFASEEPAAKEKVAKAKKGVNSPVEWKPARRVARMKEFFENKSKSAEESRNNETSKKSFIPTKLSSSSSRVFSSSARIAPKLMKTPFHSRSPSYKIMSVPKLVITPVRRSIASPANNKSGSRLSRPSSCSEYPSESSETNYSQRSRSRSASEIECDASAGADNSTKLVNYSSRLRNTTRAYFITNRKSTLRRNSPKGQSAISKRRSVGVAAKSKSPIKPVRELRKVFSPSSKPTAINQTKSIRSKLI